MHLRNRQKTVLFEGTQEKNVCLEDVPGLPTDPGDYYEDTDIIVNKYTVNKLQKLVALIFQWKQHRRKAKDHLLKIFTLC